MKIQKILVALDRSQPAEEAFEYALELADKLSAELIIVHVMEPPVLPASWGLSYDKEAVRKAIEAGRMKDVTAMLEEKMRRCKARSVKGRYRILEGNAVDQIVSAADNEKAHLLIIGNRGHTGLKRVLLGSVSSVVARVAPCPVMIVR